MKEQITPEQVAEMFAPHPDVVPKQFREQWKAGCIFGIKYGLSTPVTDEQELQKEAEEIAERYVAVTQKELAQDIVNFARKHSVTPVLRDADIQKEAKRLSDKLCLKYRLIRIDFRDKTEDFFLDTAKELAEKDKRIAELESHQLSEQEIKEAIGEAELKTKDEAYDRWSDENLRGFFIAGGYAFCKHFMVQLVALTDQPKYHTDESQVGK